MTLVRACVTFAVAAIPPQTPEACRTVKDRQVDQEAGDDDHAGNHENFKHLGAHP